MTLCNENDSHFPCTQCGLCCQRVNLAQETRYLDRGDGICRHYDAASKGCCIYNKRPDICRVDLQYRLNYTHLHSWEEFIALNLAVCQQLNEAQLEQDRLKNPQRTLPESR